MEGQWRMCSGLCSRDVAFIETLAVESFWRAHQTAGERCADPQPWWKMCSEKTKVVVSSCNFKPASSHGDVLMPHSWWVPWEWEALTLATSSAGSPGQPPAATCQRHSGGTKFQVEMLAEGEPVKEKTFVTTVVTAIKASSGAQLLPDRSGRFQILIARLCLTRKALQMILMPYKFDEIFPSGQETFCHEHHDKGRRRCLIKGSQGSQLYPPW